MSDIVEQLRNLAPLQTAVEAADTIERLEAELQTCRNTAKINLKVAQDRGARIEQLEAALKPFADYADKTESCSEGYIITSGSSMAKRQLTMGDCYKALRALEGKE